MNTRGRRRRGGRRKVENDGENDRENDMGERRKRGGST